MLINFITAHRGDLIDRTRQKVAMRLAPCPTAEELRRGVPLFLDQLVELLRHAQPSYGPTMERSATLHGAALSQRGYTVAQLVHDYGGVCQAITELAETLDVTISTEEFHTLGVCLENAIADAVTEFVRLRDESTAAGEIERSGVFAHELRNKISVATLGFQAIQAGRAPTNGSVAAMVTRSLKATTGLITQALVEVRLDSGHVLRQRVPLSSVIDDAVVEGTIEAGVRGMSLVVTPLEHPIEVEADPQILAGALANLLQNAFKCTRPGGRVSLRSFLAGERAEIEVEDECGGLPSGKLDELFEAYHQRGANRTGLGLGLFISRRGIEACGGALRVRDRPGIGCVFTIAVLLSPLAAPA